MFCMIDTADKGYYVERGQRINRHLEAMEEAAVMMVGLEVDRVYQGLMILEKKCLDLKR